MSIGDRPDKKSPDLEALFGGLGARGAERERHPMGHPSAQLGHQAHPTRARAAAAGLPVGRMVSTSDFAKRQEMKKVGVPSIGLAPPRQIDQGVAPPVQQMRQLTGLAPNSRSNSIQVDPNLAVPQLIPVLQFNGTVDDTDMLTIMLGGPIFASPLPTGLSSTTLAVCQAVLQWGVGNTNYQTTIDWKQGTMISLPANFLAVTASIGAGIGNPGQIPLMVLSAAVAYGAVPGRPNRATSTLTTTLASLGGGATQSDLLTIPNFSQGFAVNVGAADSSAAFITADPFSTTAGVGVQLYGPGGAIAGNLHWNYLYATASNLGWQNNFAYPIPNGAKYLRFGTPAGSSIASGLKCTAIFDLCF